MKILKHDLWEVHKLGYTICITTNGSTTKKGLAVMGRGCALEASNKFPNIKKELFDKLTSEGNFVHWFEKYNLFTFPVKNKWNDVADLDLIERSCVEIKNCLEYSHLKFKGNKIFLPFPGIGNGNRTKEEVLPILEKCFGNMGIILVEK